MARTVGVACAVCLVALLAGAAGAVASGAKMNGFCSVGFPYSSQSAQFEQSFAVRRGLRGDLCGDARLTRTRRR